MTVIVGPLTALIGTFDFLMTVLVSIFDCPSKCFDLGCLQDSNICEAATLFHPDRQSQKYEAGDYTLNELLHSHWVEM